MANEYEAFEDVPVGNEAMAQLDRLVRDVQEKEIEISKLAAELTKAQEQLRDLSWRQIPGLMDTIGLEEFKHKSGLKIQIKEHIEAGITEDRKAAAHKWLDENGHSGLLKRDVTVSFNKGQTAEADKLVGELAGKFSAVTSNMKVHPSTLKAWVKEELKEGSPIPLELFGVFRRRQAHFSRAK